MARLSIPAELVKSGILRTNLHAVRAVLQREFRFKHFPISLDDKVKAQQKNDGSTAYPYGWLVPSDSEIVRDQLNNRAVQLYGLRVGTFGADRNTTRVGYIFPVRMGLEMHIVSGDADQTIHMSEAALILSALQSQLSFDVRYGESFILNTRIEFPANTSIPVADTGDTTKPGGSEIVLQLIIHTYAGFFAKKSSVYDVDPIIGTSIVDPKTDTLLEFAELEPAIPEEFSSNDPRA